MFSKKPNLDVAAAYAESIQIFDEELDRLRDKIANDTITTDEQRLYDRVLLKRSSARAEYLMYINQPSHTSRFWKKVLNKAA